MPDFKSSDTKPTDTATQSIVTFALEKIRNLNATNILTFGRSPLVENILLRLAEKPPKNLNIKVIDGHVNGPVQCTYGLLNCLANELDHTNLILLGALAVLADGSLVVPRGSSAVVYLAKSFNVPVLVAIKSCQFIDKISFLESISPKLDADAFEMVTPEMISGLVTEIRILPPNSAPSVFKAHLASNEHNTNGVESA